MAAQNHAGEVPSDLFDVIDAMIRTVSAQATKVKIAPETLLIDDLAMDSLDLVRVISLLEDRFHVAVDLDEIPKIRRVLDLALTVTGQSVQAA